MAENTRFGFGLGWGTALLLALGIAIAGLGIGKGLERFRMADRTVTVKGLAEKDVESDFAVWTLGFRRGGVDLRLLQHVEFHHRDTSMLRRQRGEQVLADVRGGDLGALLRHGEG